ncbi:hypothetical protein [Dulcicalothrix desertica]|uniref:hypothetical protein n=1 Tax=Dulcicalothrix desertica TaxID=32056 RepID=UPI000F8C5D3A|nr:hypothetical protein [Dulcicalothrix desertica]TWH40468.1 hypothetical protein CAL7102_09802 [Dulcicalothrix desertica PCC 7102]
MNGISKPHFNSSRIMYESKLLLLLLNQCSLLRRLGYDGNRVSDIEVFDLKSKRFISKYA